MGINEFEFEKFSLNEHEKDYDSYA